MKFDISNIAQLFSTVALEKVRVPSAVRSVGEEGLEFGDTPGTRPIKSPPPTMGEGVKAWFGWQG